MSPKTILLLASAFALGMRAGQAQTLFAPNSAIGATGNGSENVGVGTDAPNSKLHVSGILGVSPQGPSYIIDNSDTVRIGIYPSSVGSSGYIQAPYSKSLSIWNHATYSIAEFKNNLDTVFYGKVGVGVTSPAYSLHTAGDIGTGPDRKIIARYSGTEEHSGAFGWSHLQLGNNGPNWIVAGRTAAGGSMTFVVNNTNDYAYNSFNGIPAMHIAAGGDVGIGTISPGYKLDVNGAINLASGQPLRGGGTWIASSDGANTVIGSSGPTNLTFYAGAPNRVVVQASSGNVGIGTSNPQHKLAVNGSFKAKEMICETTGWSDHVLAPDYPLAPLGEIEAHIQTHGTLPGIPSEAEVKENGVNVIDMQAKLLAKIEELTLHAIEQEKRIQRLEQENAALRPRQNP